MLKNCILKTTSFHNSRFVNAKCAEIICQNENCFAIICEYCELKLFDFDDFLLHFRNAHCDGSNQQTKMLFAEQIPKTNSINTITNKNKTSYRNIRQMDSNIKSNNTDLNIKAEDQEYSITDVDEDEYVDLKSEVVLFERPILTDIKHELQGNNDKYACVANDDYFDADQILSDVNNDDDVDDSDSSGKTGSWKCNIDLVNDSDTTDNLKFKTQNKDNTIKINNGDGDEGDDIPLSIIRRNNTFSKSKPKRHSCEFCGKFYTTVKTLKIHTKIQHLKPKNHKCTQCDEAFLDARSLNSHIKKKHTTYACPHCERTYKNAVSLRVHLLNHKEIKDFVCPYEKCEKAFVSKRRLNVHMEVHTDKRNYVCEVCGYRSRSKHALEVHKRGHTGEKPYKCPNCDRYFASKSLVNEHQAMHMTDRPYKCEVCDATFARPKALYHHKHLHLSEKKFKCKICGSAYAQAAGLSAHMRQHRLEDATVC